MAIIPALVALAPLIIEVGLWFFKMFFISKPAEREKWVTDMREFYDRGLSDVKRRYMSESAKTDLEDEWRKIEEQEKKEK